MPRTLASTYRALASEKRQSLLRELRSTAHPVDTAHVSRVLGLHPNTARVHLEVLVGSGLVRRSRQPRTTPGRPRVLYSIVAEVLDSRAADVSYRDLAQLLAQQLGEDANSRELAVRAGHRWADALALESGPAERDPADTGIAGVLSVLGELGFEPEVGTSKTDRIELHQCPFVDVAKNDRGVVCAVHLGMLSATVERLCPSMTVTDLDPLVSEDPLVCVVHLRRTSQLDLIPDDQY